MIPYGRQEILDEDIEAVIQVLKSDFLTQGPAVPRFEEAIKRVTGASYIDDRAGTITDMATRPAKPLSKDGTLK
jgi:dTDP-4-amino-4,6-dideoxygalactose transaminase